jgi:hypothetical protein
MFSGTRHARSSFWENESAESDLLMFESVGTGSEFEVFYHLSIALVIFQLCEFSCLVFSVHRSRPMLIGFSQHPAAVFASVIQAVDLHGKTASVRTAIRIANSHCSFAPRLA